MKYAVNQIRKFVKPYRFEYDFDLMNSLVNKDDLLGVEKCHIVGTINEPNNDRYLINLDFDLVLVMQCAISLEEVIYPLHFNQDVVFSFDEEDDNYLIEKETLDIDKAVLSEIVLNLPYRVIKEGYEDTFNEA